MICGQLCYNKRSKREGEGFQMIRRSIFLPHILTAAAQENEPVESLLHQTRALGYDGVDAAYEDLLKQPQLAQKVQKAELAFASIYHFCSFEKGFDAADMQRFLQDAAQLECRTVLIIPGFFTEHGDRELEMQAMIDGLRRTCEMAKAYEITVTIEDFGHIMSPCTRVEDLKRLFDAVPDLYATFDTGNFVYDGADVLSVFDVFQDRIRHVHLKDRIYEALTDGDAAETLFTGEKIYSVAAGSGVLPMAEVLHLLAQKEYDGYAAVEHFGAGNEWDYVQRSARWLESVLAKK